MTVIDIKLYKDIPIGHRQHLHDGHCAWLHGHNFDFELTFTADETDELGFVVDFGKVKFINEWISDKLDHAFMVAVGDSKLERIITLAANEGMVKPLYLDNSSAEGLAEYILAHVNVLLITHMAKSVKERNLRVSQVRLWEDSHNSVVCFL